LGSTPEVNTFLLFWTEIVAPLPLKPWVPSGA
jgi:hypothetical protein